MLAQTKTPVLVVEDEAIIGWDIAAALEDAGFAPIGPAQSIAEALALLRADRVRAAICDVNLPDGDISPVLEMLSEAGAAVVVHTGTGLPDHLRTRFSHILVFRKPTSSEELAHAIQREVNAQAP